MHYYYFMGLNSVGSSAKCEISNFNNIIPCINVTFCLSECCLNGV